MTCETMSRGLNYIKLKSHMEKREKMRKKKIFEEKNG